MWPLSIIYLYQNCGLYLRAACINYFSSYLRLVSEDGLYLKAASIRENTVFRTRNICRTLPYSQPCYIQSLLIFRTLPDSKSETYSELCQTSTMKRFAKIVNGYNYFYKLWLFSQYKLAAFSTSWNKYHEVVTPEVDILCKKL